MKRNIPILITALSIIVATISTSSAFKAHKQKKIAEAEAAALRQKMTAIPERTPRQRSPEQAAADQATQATTNALVTLQPTPANPGPESEIEPRQERPERESREDRMARMKDEDPEGYEAMIQERKERQESMRYNLAERTATFMDLDTSNMTEEERANHELLVEKMGNVWALTEQFQDPEQPPDRETMGELFNAMREVRPLMAQERTVMFKQLGTDLGYEGEAALDFANHVEEIISATNLQMPGGGRGGGRRGGGGGGGGGR
jgi:hypothetical protein